MTVGQLRKIIEHVPAETHILKIKTHSDGYTDTNIFTTRLAYNAEFGYFYDDDDNLEGKDEVKLVVVIEWQKN